MNVVGIASTIPHGLKRNIPTFIVIAYLHNRQNKGVRSHIRKFVTRGLWAVLAVANVMRDGIGPRGQNTNIQRRRPREKDESVDR